MEKIQKLEIEIEELEQQLADKKLALHLASGEYLRSIGYEIGQKVIVSGITFSKEHGVITGFEYSPDRPRLKVNALTKNGKIGHSIYVWGHENVEIVK